MPVKSKKAMSIISAFFIMLEALSRLIMGEIIIGGFSLKRFLSLFAVLGMTLSLFSGCSASKPLSKTEFFMDTVCTITLYDTKDETLLDKAFALCKKYETLFSKTIETSDISKINSAENETIEVNPETAKLLEIALEYAKLTDGKFDITIGRLTELWDFKSESPILPSQKQIETALKQTGYHNLSVNGNTVMVQKGVQLDLGGIAKGYVADQCAAFLKENGVTRAIINLGGNVLVIGSKGENLPWTVGIQRPFSDRNEIIGSVQVSDHSVVTSGIYERFFEKDGIVYHHILDPDTGYPVANGLESVTIISRSSVMADALSTSAFLLGKDRAIELIESISDTEAIFVDNDGKISVTSGIGKEIPFEED